MQSVHVLQRIVRSTNPNVLNAKGATRDSAKKHALDILRVSRE